MYKNVGGLIFSICWFIFISGGYAHALAEPKEPKPYGVQNFADDIDEQQPPDEPDMDGFEIEEPSVIEPPEPAIGNFDKDMEPTEHEINEPAPPASYDKEPQKGE